MKIEVTAQELEDIIDCMYQCDFEYGCNQKLMSRLYWDHMPEGYAKFNIPKVEDIIPPPPPRVLCTCETCQKTGGREP